MSSNSSLGRRSLRASAWVGAAQVVSQLIRLLGNLLLTRLLLPEAFGLMAVILTLMTALFLFSDIGSGTVIVQSKRGTQDDFVHTAWTLQVIRGFSLWLFGLLLAFLIWVGQAQGWFKEGSVYSDSRLPGLMTVTMFSMALQGFRSLNGKLAERDLDLRLVSLVDLLVQLGSLLAMLVAAYITRSIWALVAGSLVIAVLQCALTHTMLPGPRARFRLEPSAVKELIGKGKWVLLSSLLGFVTMNGDRMLLGGLVDATTLGKYAIALGLASIAPAALSAMLGKVIFPAFSEVVRDRPADLGRTYRRFQIVVDSWVGVVAAVMFVASDALVGLLYNENYREAGPMIAYLAVGSIGVRFLVIEQVYVAMGQPSLLALAILPRAVVLAVGLPLGYAAGALPGALVAIVISQFAHWPQAIWFRSRHGLGQLSNDVALPMALIVGAGVGLVIATLISWV